MENDNIFSEVLNLPDLKYLRKLLGREPSVTAKSILDNQLYDESQSNPNDNIQINLFKYQKYFHIPFAANPLIST